jgi:hypothetical protein
VNGRWPLQVQGLGRASSARSSRAARCRWPEVQRRWAPAERRHAAAANGLRGLRELRISFIGHSFVDRQNVKRPGAVAAGPSKGGEPGSTILSPTFDARTTGHPGAAPAGAARGRGKSSGTQSGNSRGWRRVFQLGVDQMINKQCASASKIAHERKGGVVSTSPSRSSSRVRARCGWRR